MRWVMPDEANRRLLLFAANEAGEVGGRSRLQSKFGSLPDQVRVRIRQADANTLLDWSGRIFTAGSIDEVAR